MLRWLKPGGLDAPAVQNRMEEAMEKERRQGKEKKQGRPWHKWTTERKNAVTTQFKAVGYKGLKLQLGGDCPPLSTIKGWEAHPGSTCRPAGRPRYLTEPEEEQLKNFVQRTRSRGAVVDRQSLCLMASELVKITRGPNATIPAFSHNWVRSYRLRNGLTRLRAANTDRTEASEEEIRADNAWKVDFKKVLETPSRFGIPLENPMPSCAVLAADETPPALHM